MGAADLPAITATIAAARILGASRCTVTLFVEADEADAVTRLAQDIIGSSDSVRYSPPTSLRATGVFSWGEDSDGKAVDVNIHVLPVTANDNQKEG